jgi:hypothetical protein
VRRDGPAHRHAAPLYESCQASLHCSAIYQYVPLTLPAAKANVGAKPIDEPLPSPARVHSLEGHNVAEQELDNSRFFVAHLDGLS